MFTEHYNFSRYFIFTKQTLFEEPLTVKISAVCSSSQIILLLQKGFSQAQPYSHHNFSTTQPPTWNILFLSQFVFNLKSQ